MLFYLTKDVSIRDDTYLREACLAVTGDATVVCILFRLVGVHLLWEFIRLRPPRRVDQMAASASPRPLTRPSLLLAV